jgi:DNA-binding response OmpR family regulator
VPSIANTLEVGMKGKILVIEDDGDAAKALSIQLGSAGYVVMEANTVTGAMELTRAESPDVIVLDLGLPDMDGISMLQHIKSGPVLTQVIVVTGRISRRDRALCLGLGAADYLQKPAPRKWLLEAIEKAMEETRRLRGRRPRNRSADPPNTA